MPSLTEISEGLQTATGLYFNTWIAHAFDYLFFRTEVIEETEAESDVIAEALLADEPYYIVIEGQAVLDHNQVGYNKVGQLRGNFHKYLDQRRQMIFENAYKLVVGRPVFSANAKQRSKPDSVLITAENLIHLLEQHEKFRFSQDDLEVLFRRDNVSAYGEIDGSIISRYLTNVFNRRINASSLVLSSLEAGNTIHDWTPTQQILGICQAYRRFLRVNIEDQEILDAITDMQSSLVRIVKKRDDEIKLQSVPIGTIINLIPCGEKILERLDEYSRKLEELEQSSTVS